MDFFKNVETRVRRTNTGIHGLPDGYLSNSVVNVPVNENSTSTSILNKKRNEEEEKLQQAKQLRENAFKAMEDKKLDEYTNTIRFDKKFANMVSEGKCTVFKRILTEMYIDALYLDEDSLLENFNNVSRIVDEYVDNNGGYKLLENSYVKSNSHLLKNIMNVCEATAKRVTARVHKEANGDVAMLSFELNDEETKQFDYDKRDIGVDEIASVVKDKVLSVVKEEKEKEQKHEEFMEDLENDLSENPDVVDESSVKESLSKIFIQTNPTEDGTLFNAILRGRYKDIMEGSSPILSNDFNTVTETGILDDIDFDDLELDDDFDMEETFDEEIMEVFNTNSKDVMEAIDKDDIEKLEESLTMMACGIETVVEASKCKRKAKVAKKDIRDIQKVTEELEDSPSEEGCKKKASEGCKKKAIENFVDRLEESVAKLDDVIDLHDSVMVEVSESMKKTDKKSGKTFTQPLMKLNDISMPNIKFMYKVKAVEKDINKMLKSSKNKNSAKNASKIIERNISNIEKMIAKLEKNATKEMEKKANALKSLKSKLTGKMSSVKESFEAFDESVFIEESFDLEFEEESFEEVSESNNTIDMDLILAETVAKYTLMEMCYTIKLENYRPNDIKKLAHRMLNK